MTASRRLQDGFKADLYKKSGRLAIVNSSKNIRVILVKVKVQAGAASFTSTNGGMNGDAVGFAVNWFVQGQNNGGIVY